MFAAVALVISITPGCGSDPPRKTLDADQFASAYAQALCTSLQHCCDENQVAYDYAACTRGWKADIDRRLSVGDTSYDPRTANDCIVQIQASQSSSWEPTKGSVSDARDLCMSTFIGKKPLGAPCTASSECAPPPDGRVVCDTAPTKLSDGGALPLSVGTRGLGTLAAPVCTLVQPPAPGEPCAFAAGQVGVTSCGEALFCDAATGRCKARAQAGETCQPGGCTAGTYCAALSSGSACATLVARGGACDTAGQCDSTSRCDVSGSKTCIAKKGPGDTCTDDTDCQIGSCDATTKRCLKNAYATTAACNGRGY